MPWFKVDDSFASHPKVMAIPRGKRRTVIGLWSLLGSWCAKHLTDGKVPAYMIAEMGGTSADAATLTAVGLWEKSGDDYQYHDWSDWQPTREKVEEDRAAARERVTKHRQMKRERNALQPEVLQRTSGEVTPTPTRPDPTRPKESGEPTAQPLIAEWIERCSERPPSKVIGHVSKEVKTMLEDGIAPERVRAGLAEWHRKRLHPSALASVVFGQQAKPAADPYPEDGTPEEQDAWLARHPAPVRSW